MELKVWVDGAIRVVCGLSLDTSCQDVVIALAQATGQTGRYVLIMKFKGNERNLVADECPLQQLAKLGPLAAEVQFILRRNGPSLSEAPQKPSDDRHPPPQRLSELEPVKHKGPQKAFSLVPSTLPRRTKPNKTLSSSLAELTEPQVSTATPQMTPNIMNPLPPDPLKSPFREILQQQKKLHDLETQIEALEKETELWEHKVTSAAVPDPNPGLAQELKELEFQMKQNEIDLMYGEDWEKELKVEMEREQEMQRRLQQIHLSIDDQNYEIKVLQARSEHLEQDLQFKAQTESLSPEVESWQTGEALQTLTQELHNRLHFGEELDAALSETQWELQTAEERDRLETIEELNKELRQCNLQEFIQQAGVPLRPDPKKSLAANRVYLSKSSIRK
ncbi:ras association domain-containing protein 7-like isoform X2 [Kryptolebias marmoratus]|uniref:ras association domain-containing protein 7-like isoform X2 n=1 Tax=Kryptolebias marmoratus TaxID=37003 RepID=UPI0007F92FE3|nr:ras association domain-containing protein 7-like isoform X2 [Kryptolebias marmoratus]